MSAAIACCLLEAVGREEDPVMPLGRWGPVDANISMLFTEVPLTARPAAARAAGFTAVEVWWPFGSAVPADPELAGFERAVRDAGVQLVALNGFAGNMQAGDRGILSWPSRQQEFLENLEVVLDLGARLGCRRFNLLYGNRKEGCAAAAQDELAVENLAVAARAARRAGATVLVEPLSGIARYPLRTAGDVLGVLSRLPADCADAARLLADLYHLRVNGEDIPAMLDRAYPRIGHVQVADVPGRHEPGTGTADLDGWVTRLRQRGYRGEIGLEYAPLDTTDAGLRRLGLGEAEAVSSGISTPAPLQGLPPLDRCDHPPAGRPRRPDR
jgi:hydroxypyruvate isomerase